MALPPPAPALLEARGLAKRYGDRAALDGLDLVVAAGARVGLLGPNGAGKSTALRLLGGLSRPDAGTVFVAGSPVGGRDRAWRRHLGIVTEELALWDRLTAREHLVLAGRLFGLPAGEAERRAEDLLDLLDLRPHAETFAVHASHGTAKKIALGMALLPAPRLLLLDEPFEGLDPLSAAALRRVLERFAAGGGAVVLASHVLPIVELACDRAVLLSRGRAVAAVTRAEWEAGPGLEDRFVAAVGARPDGGELPWLR